MILLSNKILNIHLIFVSIFDFKHPYSYPISDMGMNPYPVSEKIPGYFFFLGKDTWVSVPHCPLLDGWWLGKMFLSCSTPSHKTHELKLEVPRVKNSMEYFQYILSILNCKLFYYHKSNFFNLIMFMDTHGNIKKSNQMYY